MSTKYIKLYEQYSKTEYTQYRDLVSRLSEHYSPGWVRRVLHSVFSASVEKKDLELAISEWEYRGERKVENEPCQICGQTPIHYKFKITNRLNNNVYWVGCDCIQRFSYEETKSIAIFDESGNRLTDTDAIIQLIRNHYKELIKDSSITYVLNFIEKIQDTIRSGAQNQETDSNLLYLNKIYRQYAELNYFTPNQIIFIDSLVKKYNIDTKNIYKSRININLKDPSLLDDLSQMSDYNFNILNKYLDKHAKERASYRRGVSLETRRKLGDPRDIDDIENKFIDLPNDDMAM